MRSPLKRRPRRALQSGLRLLARSRYDQRDSVVQGSRQAQSDRRRRALCAGCRAPGHRAVLAKGARDASWPGSYRRSTREWEATQPAAEHRAERTRTCCVPSWRHTLFGVSKPTSSQQDNATSRSCAFSISKRDAAPISSNETMKPSPNCAGRCTSHRTTHEAHLLLGRVYLRRRAA